jgi:hypothetical protein
MLGTPGSSQAACCVERLLGSGTAVSTSEAWV